MALALQPLRYLRNVHSLSNVIPIRVAIGYHRYHRFVKQRTGLLADPCSAQRVLDRPRIAPVEHRRDRAESHPSRRPPQMRLQHLADVHPARYADRIEDDVHRSTISQMRHVLYRENPGYDALIPVSAGHLVPLRNLTSLRYAYP